MSDVTVIGAGVIGLSTALALRQAGHNVRVVAAAKGPATTSAAAGAIWYPYRVGPPQRATHWARRTLEWLLHIARTDPAAGVDDLVRYELVNDSSRPWWADAARELKLHDAGFPGDHAAPLAWSFRSPRCEPSLFLAWLEKQLPSIEIARVASLAEVSGDRVINCTGLGGRSLTGDSQLRAVYGQVVIVEPGRMDLRVCPGDERDADAIFYAIPRRHEMVLGGCALECEDDRPATPSAAMTQVILERTRALGLEPGAVKRAAAGLRPFRKTVRLEVDPHDPRVIHNYGHGGAGYTLSWGCACEVVALVGPAHCGKAGG